MASILKHARSLKSLLDNTTKLSISKVKYSSSTTRSKLIESANGERIITSQLEDLTYPEMPLAEYVWRNVNQFQNHIALECGITGRSYTYAQARDASNYIARNLRKMGFKNNDVVAIVLANYPEYALALLGCLEAGLTVTTVNPIYTADEIARQLQNSDAKAVITSADIASTVSKAMNATLPTKSPFIVLDNNSGSLPEGSIPFKDLISKGKTLPNVHMDSYSFNDVVLLPYSSGTTGLPKGVMLTNKNIVCNIEMAEQTVNNQMWQPTTETYQDVIPLILPMYHSYGLNCVTLPRLATGAKLVTIPKFIPEDYINVLIKYKATMLSLVPPVMLFLTASPNVKKHHLESVKFIFSGAAPMSETDANKFYDKFKIAADDVKFYQGYGMTETSPIATIEISGTKYSSIGQPIKGCYLRLVDPMTNKDVQCPNVPGELWVKGVHVMKGYLKNDEATKNTMHGEWLKTGDIGYYDDNYDFYITDRLKELIKVKGFQVASCDSVSSTVLSSAPIEPNMGFQYQSISLGSMGLGNNWPNDIEQVKYWMLMLGKVMFQYWTIFVLTYLHSIFEAGKFFGVLQFSIGKQQ